MEIVTKELVSLVKKDVKNAKKCAAFLVLINNSANKYAKNAKNHISWTNITNV
jgi:hypothetical protein